MKKALSLAIAGFFFGCAAIASGHANAALPELVVNSTGTVAYGTHQALAVKKDTSSGNRAAVLYQSGWQYVSDNATWTKYTKLVAGVGDRGLLVDNDPEATVIVVANSNGVYCQSNQSLIAFPNYGGSYTISDNCNFWTKVKANAN